MSIFDLEDSYFVPFKRIVEAGGAGYMCAPTRCHPPPAKSSALVDFLSLLLSFCVVLRAQVLVPGDLGLL